MRMPIFCQRLVTAPNLVTLVRPVCTPIFVRLCLQFPPPMPLWPRLGIWLLLILMISSDILDGYLARRLGQETPLGRGLDHFCDVLFVITSLGAFASRGWVPWWLPSAIAWSFALYVVDSWWRPGRPPQRLLIGSRLGHLGGILYYVTVAMVTVNLGLPHPLRSPHALHGWFLGVAVLAWLSGLEHLVLLTRAFIPRFFAGPPAESLPRSSRSEP